MFIGLDIGGSKIITCFAGRTGKLIRQRIEKTPAELKEGLALIDRMIDSVRHGQRVHGVGVCIGGPLDFKTGVVSPLHQEAWRNVPLHQILAERWKCRVALDVDTNLAALGEYHSMEIKPGRLLYLTLSTGMGGGFLIEGSIYRGADGAHPEVAHQSIPYQVSQPANVSCDCGLTDCLEGLISGKAIRRIYGKPAEELSDEEWQEVGYNLGMGLRNLAVILAPDLIVLGGGVAIGRGEQLIAQASKVMQDHLRLVPVPDVRLSKLGYYTALHGAVHAAVHGIT